VVLRSTRELRDVTISAVVEHFRGPASPGLEIAPGFGRRIQTMGIIKACVGFLVIAAWCRSVPSGPVMLANYSFQDDLKTVH